MRPSRSKRWAYMGEPGHNPPSDRCPECEQPSKVYHLGSKTVDGVKITRYGCENDHEWEVREDWEP
ncbi:MAG: hypothetical protein R3F61_00740 [Myxococcota bacterium]